MKCEMILNVLEEIERNKTLEPDEKNEISKLRKTQQLLCDATANYQKNEYSKCIEKIDMAFENIPHSIHYKITECLIRIFKVEEASQYLQQMNFNNSFEVAFLKGLLYYNNDYFESALHYFEVYKKENHMHKANDVDQLIAVSKKMQEILMPSFLEKLPYIFDTNKIILNKYNTEIQNTFKSNNYYHLAEIRMRLHYQRALLRQKMGDKNGSIKDCIQALIENPLYHNAIKLRKEILKNWRESTERTTDEIQPTEDPKPTLQHQICNNQ